MVSSNTQISPVHVANITVRCLKNRATIPVKIIARLFWQLSPVFWQLCRPILSKIRKFVDAAEDGTHANE
jgi:hypothetical protein